MNKYEIRNKISALERALSECSTLWPNDDATAQELEMVANVVELATSTRGRLYNALKDKPKKKKLVQPVCQSPWGTYGEWDYPNKDWPRKPTIDDIADICNQKAQRDPNGNLWKSEQAVVKWLEGKNIL